MSAFTLLLGRACLVAGLILSVASAAAQTATPPPAPPPEPASVALPMGGARIVPNPWIGIDEETIRISPSRVVARHVLVNRGGPEDQPLLMSVRLPRLGRDALDGARADIADADNPNFLAVTVTVDGAPVATRVVARVLAFEADVTADLVAAGVPLTPRAALEDAALAGLKPETRRDFIARGILQIDTEGRAKPGWALDVAIEWRQTFAKDKPVVVEVAHRPVVATARLTDEALSGEDSLVTSHCLPAEVARALKASVKARAGQDPILVRTIEFDWTAPNAWQESLPKGAIIVDTEAPGMAVHGCLGAMTRSGPTAVALEGGEIEFPGRVSFLLIEEPKPAKGAAPPPKPKGRK